MPDLQHRTYTLEMSEISHEQGGVDRHVEDRSGEREPRFLKAPERSHRTPYPGVEATFFRHRRGQLSDHERRGQTPEKREHEKSDQGPAITGVANDLFEPVRPARDHKVSRRQQRQHPQLPPRSFRATGPDLPHAREL